MNTFKNHFVKTNKMLFRFKYDKPIIGGDGMLFHERNINIFTVNSDYHLVHCISSDFKLGKGIAVDFDRKFNIREKLFNRYPKYSFSIGACLITDNVINLVTKERYFHKPTYENMYYALLDAANQIHAKGIPKISMPYIGCGLDKLNWPHIRCMICNIFSNTNVEILVCSNKTYFNQFIQCQCDLAPKTKILL